MGIRNLVAIGLLPVALGVGAVPAMAQASAKKPNIVILMTDDTGWGDWGYITGGGTTLGHPTPNIDRIAKEGTYFTNWYGQAAAPPAVHRS